MKNCFSSKPPPRTEKSNKLDSIKMSEIAIKARMNRAEEERRERQKCSRRNKGTERQKCSRRNKGTERQKFSRQNKGRERHN
jgi:hypothetical protein